jgi:antitoxin component HigA of HigAB toxin-antitoxin module
MTEIFPIRRENDYRKALHLLEHSEVGTREAEDRIEILAQLVELWEQKHFAPLTTPAPGDVLRELMLAKRVTQGELSSLLGTPQTNISALISGKRKLNADQVALLCEYFHVGAEIFGDVKKARFKITKKVTNRSSNAPSSQRMPSP